MNYKLIKKQYIKDIGTGYIYEHKKSGAKIVYIKNNDKNKVFSICLKTMPEDNSGIFHILEHCVLCGSKKYRLKEPFNQLDKCTLNTYLNAMTFEDKTLYPVASLNNKDYAKLIDVYLDAVFFPLIEEKKGIFLQEGWNFNGKDINGVVYNEMKGVYSAPDAQIDLLTKKNLFIGSGYAYDSGGYPEDITSITHDDFINTYKKYYAPSNSIIYFYGDLDIEHYLNYLDNDYLCNFERIENIDIQKPYDLKEPKYIEKDYFLGEGGKNCIQASFKLNFCMEEEKNIAFDILADILTENQEAILKNALYDNGICSDVTSYIEEDMLNPVFTILIENTEEENIEKFKAVLEKTIKEICIDEKMVKSSIATLEFFYKEKDFGYKPKGLFYNITLLRSMLYGKYDFDILDFNTFLDKVSSIDLREILIKNTIENKNAVYCILRNKEKNTENKNKIFKKNTKELIEYQSQKDTEKELEKISPLHIKEIDKKANIINTQIRKINKKDTIYNKIDSDICYLNFIFNISHLANEYKRYISIYAYLLGKLNTKKYNTTDLDQDIGLYIGEASNTNGIIKTDKSYFKSFTFSVKILNKNIDKAFYIIDEILSNTLFNDKQKIKKILLEYIQKYEIDIVKSPKEYAIKKAKSNINNMHMYMEEIDGVDFYYWLKNLTDNIDKNMDNIIQNMLYIHQNIYNINNVYFGVASSEIMYTKIENLLKNATFLKDKKNNTIDREIYIKNIPENKAIAIPSDVNYNAMASIIDYGRAGYTGHIEIVKRIINSDYLWEKIRTDGGAYGGEISITRGGTLCINSYSDPHIKKSYSSFKKISQYLTNLYIDEKTLHMYKIGTINIEDRPIKDYEINEIAIYRYFMKLDENMIHKRREDILYARRNDLDICYDMIGNAIKNANICTLGDIEKIEKDKTEFDKIIRL